jgi:diaminopimelate epimerase
MGAQMILSLTKHHGLGNDFLVLLDPSDEIEVTADLAQRLCERRTGIGADGLLHLRKAGDGADLELTVWNADGSIAETSGNGLRCAGQAAADAGLVDDRQLFIRTGGAVRSLTIGDDDTTGTRIVVASMGLPTVEAIDAPAWGRRAAAIDTGNPHVVVEVDDLLPLDDGLMEKASRVDFGQPVNLEAVRLDGAAGQVTLRVWERGVGETRACGSGAVASAAAARHWGMPERKIAVAMPGGAVHVRFREDGEAFLLGPAKFVGRIEVDPTRIAT